MRPFAKVFAISACLICAMLLSGCICAVPICTLTPHSPRFQLPEAEWGATDRRLVVACYRLQYSKEPQPPVRFRVLSLSAEGSYEPPAELLIGLAGIGYVGEIRACAASQAPAAIAIFGPDGQVGIYEIGRAHV